MLPSACGLWQHFQDLGHSFSLYGPPSRQITYKSFSFCSKLVLQITNGFASVCLRNFVIESTCASSANDWFIKNLRIERVNSDTQQRCEEIFFDLLYDSAFISPFISPNLTMPVFCIGSSEGRTESDDKGLVCYYWVSVKCGPDGGGWRMADRKMRMENCGW